MITYTKKQYLTDDKVLVEGVCLSGDSKPTGDEIANGSTLIEMNTSTLYIYDEYNKTWRAWE